MIAVLLVLAGGGAVLVLNRSPSNRICTAAGTIGAPGAETPEAARALWATDLDVDVEHPLSTGGSGDRVTARYPVPTPATSPVEQGRDHFREVVTERGADDLWRVTSANRCAEW
jgi:hypothetical protein